MSFNWIHIGNDSFIEGDRFLNSPILKNVVRQINIWATEVLIELEVRNYVNKNTELTDILRILKKIKTYCNLILTSKTANDMLDDWDRVVDLMDALCEDGTFKLNNTGDWYGFYTNE